MSQVPQILTFLREHPEGASISEISIALKINRNFAAKYLTTLYMQGQIDLRSYGKVRLYQICTRVPFHAICLMSDGVALGVDRLGIIRDVSGQVDTLLNCQEEALIGVQLKDLDHPVLSDKDIQDQVRQLIERKGRKPIHRTMISGDRMFRITLIACIFDDAMTGVGIQISDLSSWFMRQDPGSLRSDQNIPLIGESTEFVVRIGPDEKILFVNPAYVKYCGLTAEELIGTQGLPFLSTQDMILIREAYLRSHPEQGSGPVEIMVLFQDGDIRWQEWIVFPSFHDKTLHEIHLYGRDVTEQKYQEMEIRELRRGIAQIFEEKISDMREGTLRLSQEITDRKAEGLRLKNQVRLVCSLLSDHPVVILETDSAGIITSAMVPDEISQLVSGYQLMGLFLRNILFEDDSSSGERFSELSGGNDLPFHLIPCHVQIGSSLFQVVVSGIPLKGPGGTFDGMCITIEFPTD